MMQSNYRADQRLITVWADKSGEAIDWLRRLIAPRGVEAFLPEVESLLFDLLTPRI
jgi:hypothetical protein